MKYGGWPMDLSSAPDITDVKVSRPDGSIFIIPADHPFCNFFKIPAEFKSEFRLSRDLAQARKERGAVWLE